MRILYFLCLRHCNGADKYLFILSVFFFVKKNFLFFSGFHPIIPAGNEQSSLVRTRARVSSREQIRATRYLVCSSFVIKITQILKKRNIDLLKNGEIPNRFPAAHTPIYSNSLPAAARLPPQPQTPNLLPPPPPPLIAPVEPSAPALFLNGLSHRRRRSRPMLENAPSLDPGYLGTARWHLHVRRIGRSG